MVARALRMHLLGRQRESGVLDQVLQEARAGRGGVVAVYGEPGVGKTALLDYAAEAADDFLVARTVGVEAEIELAFAALQQLCSPFRDLLDRPLPAPQRDALNAALGLSAGRAPSPFLVGLAVLNVFSEAAEQRPLLCVVDDAHWLDHASARVLAFVARRLLAEKVAIVFAARQPIEGLAGATQLRVEPLGHRDARALLDSVLPAKLDERVLERIVVETRGNPLAILELPRGLTPSQLAGGFALPGAVPLSAQIEESFRRRLALLPPDARRLLLVAAADPTGDTVLVWRAVQLLGIPPSATRAVQSVGLVTFDGEVTFRHPLVRSAVYRAASPDQRSDVHRALAESTDPAVDPDRRAWHRAQAASGPDADVATELERSATRAEARGGLSAAAAFLERSSDLTIDPWRRSARALAAAEAKQQAGSLDDALALIARAEAGPLDERQRAHVDVLRARVSFAADRGRQAPTLLLSAAKRLEPLDSAAARGIYLEALTAAFFAGGLGADVDARQVAMAVRTSSHPRHRARPTDLLLEGLVALIINGPAAGIPLLRTAVSAFTNDEVGPDEGRRWLWLAGRVATYVWDYENADALTQRQIRVGRESGALTVLPVSLSSRASIELHSGNLAEASSLIAEGNAITDAIEGQKVPYAPTMFAAFRGREPDASRLIHATMEDFRGRGEGMGLTVAHWATALLHNGLARYDIALAAARQATEDPHELWFTPLAMLELIEAATRTGSTDLAARGLDVLTETTSASGTPWAQGVEARSRALLANGEFAEGLYREAIDLLEPTRLRVDLARTHLLYGEWLRRERRRLDARTELRTAHDLFAQFGMEAFAERARIELEATGERARKRTADSTNELTPQEAQIARLVTQGHSNREIAAQLFISQSTVEYHLRKVFVKLDIKSRTQLARRIS